MTTELLMFCGERIQRRVVFNFVKLYFERKLKKIVIVVFINRGEKGNKRDNNYLDYECLEEVACS